MAFFDLLKRKTQTQKSNQTEASQIFSTKYPIVLFENTAINARPPYKILQFKDGVFIQIIDLMCRRFNDICTIGNYSIALFKIYANEVEWIKLIPTNWINLQILCMKQSLQIDS